MLGGLVGWHAKVESIATGDFMNVLGNLTRADDGIGTLVYKTACARNAEKVSIRIGKSRPSSRGQEAKSNAEVHFDQIFETDENWLFLRMRNLLIEI